MSIRGVGAVWSFVLLGLASGCADSFLYTPLLPPPRPMSWHPGAAVELLVVTPPTRPHTNVGMINAFAGANRSVQQLIDHLRERAGSMGCDAILLTSIEPWISQHHSRTIQASCIVYNDAAPVSSSYR